MIALKRFVSLGLLAGLLLAACQSPTQPTPKPLPTGSRPNFMIVISDDQRYDTMDFMPRTKKLVFDAGVTFTKAYVTTPLCCPSRSSILTGLYAHNHNARTNTDPLEKTTLVERLHAEGYFTGIVGKYLNSWEGERRPEFDYWAVIAGHGVASKYFDPRLNVNGVWKDHSGYVTFVLRDYAVEMARKAGQQDKPFVLIFASNAPHDPAEPAPGDEKLYEDLPLYRPPSYREEDLSDKPDWLQNRPPLKGLKRLDEFRLKQLRALNALDQAVESVINSLGEQGKLDNTMVIYLSDNAVFLGEHQLNGKTFVYEEAIHVPFAIRYPPLTPAPRVDNHLVSNIDIAPTLYELAGIPVPREVDGRSLAPLLQSKGDWRDALLIEGWPEQTAGGEGDGDQSEVQNAYTAIHTDRYVYVETEGDRPELYDLTNDPYQLENQASNPAYAMIVAELEERLSRARAVQGGSP